MCIILWIHYPELKGAIENMADLKATYMGIELKNPVIAGASELTSNMDSIRKIEDSGAGALVIKSLFEELNGLFFCLYKGK